MITIAHSGPDSLLLSVADRTEDVRLLLSSWGTKVPLSREEALGVYGSNRRIVFLSYSQDCDSDFEEELSETYVSENIFAFLFCDLINRRLISGIDGARMMRGCVMMRLIGNIEAGMAAVRHDLGGEIIDSMPLYRPDIPSTSSKICFTEKPLNRAVPRRDIASKAILVHDRSRDSIIRYLTQRGEEYLATSMGTTDWNMAEVKIYDADGHYKQHRQRLWAALQGLQAGVVLEEQWGKDQAMVMMSVPVYVVRVYTPMDARDIKRIAMGLEYDSCGQRFVDLDVFYKGKKLSSYAEFDSHPGMTRNDIGMNYRNNILKNTDSDSRNELLKIERELAELQGK